MSAASQLFSGGVAPVGTIAQGQFAGDSDWLLCDGSDYLSSAYPALDKTDLKTYGSNAANTVYLGSYTPCGVAFGNGLFVVVNRSSTTYFTSTDGVNWTSRTLPGSNAYGSYIAFGNGVFAIVVSPNASTASIYTSTDGINWTSRGTIATTQSGGAYNYPGYMSFAGGLFFVGTVAANGNYAYYTSPDGITWTQRAWGYSFPFGTVRYGGGRYVVTSAANYVCVSNSGVSWAYAYLYFHNPVNTSGGFNSALGQMPFYGAEYHRGVWYIASNRGLLASRDLRVLTPASGISSSESGVVVVPFSANGMLHGLGGQGKLTVEYDGAVGKLIGTSTWGLLDGGWPETGANVAAVATDGTVVVVQPGAGALGALIYVKLDTTKFRTPVVASYGSGIFDDTYLRSYIKAK